MRDKSLYVIYGINGLASTDELSDETKRLCDVQPYFCILKIREKPSTTNNKINKNISNLIGKSVLEFRSLKNAEVSFFFFSLFF